MNTSTMQLSGVRGWLMWFVIALCLLGPALMYSNLSTTFEAIEGKFPSLVQVQTWEHYKTYRYILLGIIVAARWSAGYMLTNILERKSVKYAIAVLWVTAAVHAVGSYVAAVAAFGNVPSSIASDSISLFIEDVVLAIVWTAYLLRSKRVMNTYS